MIGRREFLAMTGSAAVVPGIGSTAKAGETRGRAAEKNTMRAMATSLQSCGRRQKSWH